MAVRYRPHPGWGERVLAPDEVPEISRERLRQLDPIPTWTGGSSRGC